MPCSRFKPLLLTSLLALPVSAFDSEWAGQITGDGRSLTFDGNGSLQVAHASGRAQWYGYGDTWDLEAHYQLDTLWASDRNMAQSMIPSGQQRFRLWDLEPELATGSEDFRLWQNLDRLNIRYAFPNADMTVGRQAISFGLARMISPSDVLTPQIVSAEESGFRAGVDALRFELPMGELSQVDLGYVAGDNLDPDLGAAFARLRTSQQGVDMEFTGIHLGDRYLVSSGAQGALGEYGLWAEFAWLQSDDEGGLRYSLGTDWTLFDDLYSQLEFHHNDVGNFGGLVSYYDGENYLSLLASKPISALLNATVQSSWEFNQQELAISGALGYSLGDETSMTLSGVYTEAVTQMQLAMQRYF